MTILPIVGRDMRVRARSPGTYWLRVIVASFGAGVCGFAFILPQGLADETEIGRAIFAGSVAVAFFVCCLSFILTADVISSEKREGTLGLLLLTRLKSADVLVGKMCSASAGAFAGLAVLVPFFFFPVLTGGVTGAEVFRKILALLGELVLALSAGIWVSVRAVDQIKAVSGALLLVVCTLPLSGAGLTFAGDTFYSGWWQFYWLVEGLVILLTIYLLLAANCHLSQNAGKDVCPLDCSREVRPVTDAPLRPRAGNAPEGHDPIEWCVLHQPGVRRALWFAAAMLFLQRIGLMQLWLFAYRGYGVRSWGVFTALSLAFQLASGALIAWVASRFFLEMRRTGDIEVLLSTPIGAGSSVAGQWRALRRLVRWPIIVSLLPYAWRVSFSLADGIFNQRLPFSAYQCVSGLIGIINGLLTAVALCWLGMWFGLKARRMVAAIAWTLALAIGLPYLLSAFVMPWLTFLPLRSLTVNGSLFWVVQANHLAPFAAITAMVFWARRRLQSDLRGIVNVRFGARSDWSEVREAWNRRRRGREQLSNA